MLPGPTRRLNKFRNDFRKLTRLAELQQKNGQSITEESNRLVDQVQWTTELSKKEVDRRLEERLQDIKFLREELQVKKCDSVKEEEALKVHLQRIEKLIAAVLALQAVSLEVKEIRDKNPYAKGTVDLADRAIANELQVFQSSLEALAESRENIKELIRKLRESVFELDKDLKYKDDVQAIEELCCAMKEKVLNLKETKSHFKREGIPQDEWQKLSFNRIARSSALIQQGTSFRSFVVIQLREVVENLRDQFHRTNEKFRLRIAEMKDTKLRLENTLKTTLDHMNTIDRNLVNLDKELLGKHGFINLCTTRLTIRSQRQGQELCADSVQHELLKELAHLQKTVATLKAKIEEANYSRKHLQAASLQLKENIGQQSYLIQLNEVDCMTRRENLQLQSL